jgi:hypothetical protein
MRLRHGLQIAPGQTRRAVCCAHRRRHLPAPTKWLDSFAMISAKESQYLYK